MYKKIIFVFSLVNIGISFAAEQSLVSNNASTQNPAIGICTINNIRGTYSNEDRYINTIVSKGNLCAVFDGHGGNEVSDTLQKVYAEKFSQLPALTTENITTLYSEIDKCFTTYISGSTACCVYIKDKIAHFINLGDSRAVLVNRSGQVEFATTDHTFNNKDERFAARKKNARLVDLNGFSCGMSSNWRLQGENDHFLVVSRSFGDYQIDPDKNILLTTPDITKKEITDNHFICIASDGLWDVMSSDTVGLLIQQKTTEKYSAQEIALFLANKARERYESKDDITVLVINLKELQKNHN